MSIQKSNLTLEVKNGVFSARRINLPVQLSFQEKEMLSQLQPADGIYVLTSGQWSRFLSDEVALQTATCRVLLTSSAFILDEPARATSVPPLGIWRLASFLSQKISGLDVLVCDPNLAGMETLERMLANQFFDFVGLSVIPANYSSDLKIARLIKKFQPNTKLVLGGPGSGVLADASVTTDFVADAVVIGSGEEPFKQIIDMHMEDSHQKHAAPLVLRDKKRRQPTPVDVTLIPYGTGDVVHTCGYDSRVHYHKFSNACPEKCFWCVSPKEGITLRNPQDAVDALESSFVPSWHTDISVVDNNLAAHLTYMNAVCTEIAARGSLAKVPKHGKATINGMTEELLGGLAEAGYVRIAYGIESFSASVREQLGKEYTDVDINQVLDSTIRYGIRPEINLILCSPYETRRSLVWTLGELAYWTHEHDCLSLANLGLYCTISSKGYPENLQILTQDNGNKEIPWVFKPGEEVLNLFHDTLMVYGERVALVEKEWTKPLPNHLKSLMKCKVLAELLGEQSIGDMFAEVYNRQEKQPYIHV